MSAALTDRQAEVLRLVALGTTNLVIGYDLGISEQTVKNHVSCILRKFDVPDRTSAVVAAIGLGIVPVPVSIGSESWSAS